MNKKIRIIYSKNPDEIFNRKAALGSYIYALGGLLQDHGYTVFINEHAYGTIKQTIPSADSTIQSSGYKKIIPGFIKQIAKDLLLFRRLKKFTEKLKPGDENLILEFYSYGSRTGYDLASKKNIPLIVIYDAPVVDEYILFNKNAPFFLRKINKRERQTLLKANTTVVYSNAVKDYVWNKTGMQTQVELHQNIDFTRFDFLEQKLFKFPVNIGFIGSFLKWHRVDLLLDVFLKLREEKYDLKLYLLGMGEEYPAIKRKWELHKYKDDIVLPGFADGAALLDFKKEIHIGVMPGSNWYGAPNKIFEYGASHMAVVAPDTPTIKDLFSDKKEIYMFENNSQKALYTALKQACDNIPATQQLAENLYRKIRTNYSKNNTFDFYNSLIIRANK